MNTLIAAVIGKHWHPTDDTARDDVMLLVADLLRAHAETWIEMQTWRAALDVVLDHLAAEPEGADLLHRLGRPAWFTVIGATKDGQREPVAVLPGRRRLEVAIGVWTAQVQARPQQTPSEQRHVWPGLPPETVTLRSIRSVTRIRRSVSSPVA